MKKENAGSILFGGAFAVLVCLYAYKGPYWVWYLDDILHAMGGVVVCSFSLWDSQNEQVSWRTRTVLSLGFVALLSIVWEEFYYYFRQYTVGNAGQYITLDDTMTDFSYALLGGSFRLMWWHLNDYRKEEVNG